MKCLYSTNIFQVDIKIILTQNKDKLIWIDIDRWIISYDSISTKNTLREVTVTTFSTLQNCKAIRENFGGDNLHHEQGNGIPEDLDKQYYYDPECSKKYVYAKTLAKRKENKDA